MQGEITASDNVAKYKKKKINTLGFDNHGIYTNLSKHLLSADSTVCLWGASLQAVDLRCGQDKVFHQITTVPHYLTQFLQVQARQKGSCNFYTLTRHGKKRQRGSTLPFCLQKGQVPLGAYYMALLDSLACFLKAQS